jgi:hypothetical protein
MQFFGVTVAATDPELGYDLLVHLQTLPLLYNEQGNQRQTCNFRIEVHNNVRQYSILLANRDSAHALFEQLTTNKRFIPLEILIYQEVTLKKEAVLA